MTFKDLLAYCKASLAGYISIIVFVIWAIYPLFSSSSISFTIPAMIKMGALYLPNYNSIWRIIFSTFVVANLWQLLLIIITLLLFLHHGYDLFSNTEFIFSLLAANIISNIIIKHINTTSYFGYGPTAGLIALAALLFCSSTQGKYQNEILQAIGESIAILIIACLIQFSWNKLITGLVIGLLCGAASIIIRNKLAI